ncbi:MAG: 5'-nucleotidase, partial [Candidatus Riflebacteria bacterium]
TVVEMISHPLYVEKIGLDTELAMIEEEYLREIRIEMARSLGISNVNLYRGVNGGDSPEGSFLADAMRESVNADLAFINFGGIRQPLFKGELNVESAFLVQPFDNCIEVLNMTGAQIYDMLERAVSNKFVPMDLADKDYAMTYFSIKADGLKRVVGPDYGYLYPSNLKITFDPANEPMKRLVKVEFPDSTPLDPKKTYRVALNDFIAGGGDGFTVLKGITDREKTDILVRNALISHIEKVKEIKSRPEKRMFNLRLSEESLD